MRDEPEFTVGALFNALIEQLADVAYLEGGSGAFLRLRSGLPENAFGGCTVSGLELRECAELAESQVILRDVEGHELAVVEVAPA